MFLKPLHLWDETLSEEFFSSITKWGTIDTPHERLLEKQYKCLGEPLFDQKYSKLEYTVTEKIDGTNIGLIYCYSKNQAKPLYSFLRGRGEIMGNFADQVVSDSYEAFRIIMPIKDRLEQLAARLTNKSDHAIVVLYGELYGPGINAGKRYSGHKKFRLFGAKVIDEGHLLTLLDIPIESHNHHRFRKMVPFESIRKFADFYNVSTVPVIGTVKGCEVDTPLKIREYLLKLPYSNVASQDHQWRDELMEGVVLRHDQPFRIYKLKYQDYFLREEGGFIQHRREEIKHNRI